MKNPKKKAFLFLAFIFLTTSIAICYSHVRPVVKEYTANEVQSVIRNVINAANEVVLSKNVDYNDMFTIKKDESDVYYVSANSGLLNQISMLWATEIQKGIDGKKSIVLKKPMGIFLGNAWLAKFGKDVEITINFTATSRTEYKSMFTQSGINQTLHRLYLTAYVDAVILTPLHNENVVVDETYLFCESIINGKVPSTYISASEYMDYLDLLE